MRKSEHPKIVIVGRPNVGKSSLFNRIVGSRKAIVEATCGTTRDRLYADIKWKARSFTIVDTGGFEPAKRGDIPALILKQLEVAIDEADIIFLVTDSTVGVLPQDIDFAEKLRKTAKRIYLIANKADDRAKAADASEFYELGIGEPYAVSAVNGTGIDRLLDEVARHIGKAAPAETKASVRVAIVGRPNVGKSSYINAVFKEERVIVHPMAGTTRDAIDTDFEYKDRDYVLVDTAGIRHNLKVSEAADFFGSVRSKEAIRRADVAIVMIDGYDGLREDDRRIVEFVINEGKALIVAVNKWDLTRAIEMSKYIEMITRRVAILKHYPIVFISSKTGRNVLECLDAVWAAFERSKTVIPPVGLKELLKALNNTDNLRRRRIKFHYFVQEGSMPPSFVLGIRDPGAIGENMRRYVENSLRAAHDFLGVPLRIRYNT